MRRIVILAALAGVLAIAACTPSTEGQPSPVATPAGPTGPAGATASATAPASTPDAAAAITVLDFKLDPATLAVSGSTLSLAVTNAGPTVHNVTVRDGAGDVLFGTADLREGESETLVGPIAPGEYVLFCSLAGHESLGIKGTLTVTTP